MIKLCISSNPYTVRIDWDQLDDSPGTDSESNLPQDEIELHIEALFYVPGP